MGRGRLPSGDVGLVAALVVATAIVLLIPGIPSAVEWTLAVPFLVFYPGYAIVSAAFPGVPSEAGPPSANPGGGPGWVARLALALGASGVALAVVGVVIGWTVGYERSYVVGAVGAVTLVGLIVAVLRRAQYPAERQANLLADGAALLRPSGSRLQSFALAIAVVALLASVAYAGATAPPQDGFTEFSLLAENEDGELVATDYPRSFVAGEGHPLHLVVENNEGTEMRYEVVVVAQTVGTGGTVTDEEQVDRLGVTVPDGERAVLERQIAPTSWSDGVRLRFLLHKGEAPEDPDVESADLSLQLWIDVVEE